MAENISRLIDFLQSHNVENYLVLIRCPDHVEYRVVDYLFNRLGGYTLEEQTSAETTEIPGNSMLVSLMGGSADELTFVSGWDDNGSFLQVGFGND